MNQALLDVWPFVLAGYLAGSFPTGVILGRIHGQDPRKNGSGNVGASNVTRVLGKRWGALTLVIDMAKGALPVWVALEMSGQTAGLVSGVAAVLGHCYPPWLGFKGGKGVATAFGVVGCVLPVVATLGAMAWITLVYFTRIPATGSLVAAALFVALPQLENTPYEVHFFTLSIALIIFIRHIGNLRTLKGRYVKKK